MKIQTPYKGQGDIIVSHLKLPILGDYLKFHMVQPHKNKHSDL